MPVRSPATRTNDLQTTPILPLRLIGGRDTNRGGGRKDVGTSEPSGANDTVTVSNDPAPPVEGDPRIDTDVFPVFPGDQPLDPLDGFDPGPGHDRQYRRLYRHGGRRHDADTIFGGAGNDTLEGGIDDDVIDGGGGDDLITDVQGSDSISGG